jgi:hypothetical protein
VDDVVLDVERFFGVIGERDQTGQRLVAGGKQPDAGKILAGFIALDDAPQRGRGGVLQCRGVRLFHVPR